MATPEYAYGGVLSWAKATREKETSRTEAKMGMRDSCVLMVTFLETLILVVDDAVPLCHPLTAFN
jgi:hypothetical protein